MSDRLLILSVIGDDRPGLVGDLSAVVSAHQGNWLESSMAHLGGKFAGIVQISVPEASSVVLKEALQKLAGLRIAVESSQPAPAVAGRRLKLAVVGHDRIGIVREVSQVLARHAVNVEALETHTSSAPMSAETLFHATADLMAAHDLDVHTLTRELEKISNDLMVDISLDESLR